MNFKLFLLISFLLFSSCYHLSAQTDSEKIKTIRKLVLTDVGTEQFSFSEKPKRFVIANYYKFDVADPLAPGALELIKIRKVKNDGSNLREDIKDCSEADVEMQGVKSEMGKMRWLRAGGLTGSILIFITTIVAAESNPASAGIVALPFLSLGGTITSFVFQKKHKEKRAIHLSNAVDRYNEWIAKRNSVK